MAEGETTKGYRPRGRLMRAVTGAGVVGVALVMVLSAASMATTVKAPYKGAVSPFSYSYFDGCATSKIVKPGSFNLKTGKGSGGYETANAKSCAGFPTPGGGYADTEAGATVALELKIPTGTHNVTPTIDTTFALSGSMTTSGACPSSPFNDHYFYNYSIYGFEYWINESAGGSGFCYADSGAEAFGYAWLYDATNGSDIPISSGPGCTYVFSTECYMDFGYNYTENYTDILWGYVENFTEFYTGGSYYYNYSCANCNYSYATPWTSFSSSASATADPSFVYGYLASHVYAFEVEFYGFAYADNEGWKIGSTSTASINMATMGNGVSIPSISIV